MFTAAGKSAAVSAANYIEDVFSTYLYTGNGSTQTITNGIDLSTKGGLVWIKSRSAGFLSNVLSDTARGNTKVLYSNLTAAQDTLTDGITAFNTTGFSLGASSNHNESTYTFASWTFREQAKFFDVVTYSGNGINGRQISHNLGSTPGTIIVKVLNAADNWPVWHRSAGGTLRLDSSEGTGSFANVITTASSTTFTVTNNGEINGNGYNYVAYIFAHDAGGFGLSGTDNVITCGSFSSTGSGGPSEINLGYEPQWVMLKTINSTGSWTILDNMRGWVSGTTGDSSRLFANLANAESVTSVNFRITSTGFTNVSGTTNYIYIAIRRGPMKTPTTGTSVFSPNLETTSASAQTLTTNFPVDLSISTQRTKSVDGSTYAIDRLRGTQASTSCRQLATNSTAAEYAWTTSVGFGFDNNTAIVDGYWPNVIGNPYNIVLWNFRRAPGFFDVVCYTGTGSATTVTHNLGVAPEIVLVKRRDAAGGWFMYTPTTGATAYLRVDSTLASTTFNLWNDTAPTSSVFSLSTNANVNASASTYVAYLFATVAGVSKVGSYTGTGALQTINCGFAAGARFVLIKRTDSTGDWWVYDSARGITSGNDPYLLLNSTAAEVTGTNYVDTASTGFQVTAAAPAGLNANGGTYIFLAIA